MEISRSPLPLAKGGHTCGILQYTAMCGHSCLMQLLQWAATCRCVAWSFTLAEARHFPLIYLKSIQKLHKTRPQPFNPWIKTSFVLLTVASSPGLPMFLNITCEKLERPGRFCDVIIMYYHNFCCVSLSPPTRPCNHNHIASYGSSEPGKI